jgi:hypothetical protein
MCQRWNLIARRAAGGHDAIMKPRRLSAIRKGAWAVALSAAIGVIASRVNRSVLIPYPPHQAVLDQMLPDVELDTRTFASTIHSLAKQARATFVIDPALSAALAKDEEQTPWPAEMNYGRQHFHNVQLGSLLVRVLDEWGARLPVECRIDGTTLTFHSPDSRPPAVRRIYDLRKLTTDVIEWRKLVKTWRPPKRPARVSSGGGGGGLFGGGGGGLFGGASSNGPDEIAEELTEFVWERVDSREFNVIAVWSGWVVIEAPANLQEQFQQLLATWNQGGSLANGDKP